MHPGFCDLPCLRVGGWVGDSHRPYRRWGWAGRGTYHEQLQQQHQQKQQALGRWLLAGCTVVGEVSCRDIGRGDSVDAGPAY